jgi:hypothetical protein
MMVDQENMLTSYAERETQTWMIPRKPTISLFVDRATQQWIARDNDGQYWSVPVVEYPWNHRQPFEPTEDTELEPVPGHYKHMLGVPL